MSDLAAVISVDGPSWYLEAHTPGPAGLTNYYAPLPVFFEGWKSTPRDEIVEYEWDFGDLSPKFYGFNAAHIYETPGTYTVTLKVTRASAVGVPGETATDTIEVTVNAPDGTVYYVDSAIGDDAYDGKSATVDGGGVGPWKTATKAFSGMATTFYEPGDTILFNRGQTFELDSAATVPIEHWKGGYGYSFSTYGVGDKPLIQNTGVGGGYMIYNRGVGLRFVSFVDLVFDCTPVAGAPAICWGSVGGVVSLGFLRVDIRNFDQGWLVNGVVGSPMTSGFIIDDCTAYNSKVTHLYFVANRIGILNSDFELSGNHIAYCTSMKSAVIDGNTFSKVAFGRAALRIAGDDIDYLASNCWVSNNTFTGWIDPISDTGAHNGGGNRYNYCLLDFCPNTPNSDRFGEYLMFTGNTVTDAEIFAIIAAWEHVVVKDNTFKTQDLNAGEIKMRGRLHIGHSLSWDRRPSYDVQILDNTFEFTGATPPAPGSFIRLYSYAGPVYTERARHEDIVVKRNIFRNKFSEVTAITIPWYYPYDYGSLDSDYNMIYAEGISGVGPTFTPTFCRAGTKDFLQPCTIAVWRSQVGKDISTVVTDNFDLPTPGWVTADKADNENPIALTYKRAIPWATGATTGTVTLWVRTPDGIWIETTETDTGESGGFSFNCTAGKGIYYFAVVSEDSLTNESPDPVGYGTASLLYNGPTDLPDEPDVVPEPKEDDDTREQYGTGAVITGIESACTVLSWVAEQVIKATGRYDLVVDAPGGNYADNGIYYYINKGQYWLDMRAAEFGLRLVHLATLAANGSFIEVEGIRAVDRVWLVTSEGAFYPLEEVNIEYIRKLQAGSVSVSGTGSTPRLFSVLPIQLTSMLASTSSSTLEATYSGVGELHFGTGHRYRGILLYPPTSETTTIRIEGLFFSPKLTSDVVYSYWLCMHPTLLVDATIYEIVSEYENKSEIELWFNRIELRLMELVKDEIEHEMPRKATWRKG